MDFVLIGIAVYLTVSLIAFILGELLFFNVYFYNILVPAPIESLWKWLFIKIFDKKPKCAVCGKKPDPSLYNSGMMTIGGDYGKCPECGKVFCADHKKIEWLDQKRTMWLAYFPDCDKQLKADIIN